MTKVKIYTVLCTTSKYGNFHEGVIYPVYYKDIYASSKLPCSPYAIDEDGDKMPLDFFIRKPTKFHIEYTWEEHYPNKNYGHIDSDIHKDFNCKE